MEMEIEEFSESDEEDVKPAAFANLSKANDASQSRNAAPKWFDATDFRPARRSLPSFVSVKKFSDTSPSVVSDKNSNQIFTGLENDNRKRLSLELPLKTQAIEKRKNEEFPVEDNSGVRERMSSLEIEEVKEETVFVEQRRESAEITEFESQRQSSSSQLVISNSSSSEEEAPESLVSLIDETSFAEEPKEETEKAAVAERKEPERKRRKKPEKGGLAERFLRVTRAEQTHLVLWQQKLTPRRLEGLLHLRIQDVELELGITKLRCRYAEDADAHTRDSDECLVFLGQVWSEPRKQAQLEAAASLRVFSPYQVLPCPRFSVPVILCPEYIEID